MVAIWGNPGGRLSMDQMLVAIVSASYADLDIDAGLARADSHLLVATITLLPISIIASRPSAI
jgi:hypothetical protein